MTEAMRDAAANLDSSLTDQSVSATISATQLIQEAADSEQTSGEGDVNSVAFKIQYPELEGRSLPPIGPVLKLLRLTQTEKQRFFIDVPVIDEAEFVELSQKVYFAIHDYSLSTWAIVNTGLYYLFLALEEHDRSLVGVTLRDIQAFSQLLSANIEAAIQSFRLCYEPSTEGCQALALLVSNKVSFSNVMLSSRDGILYEIGTERIGLVINCGCFQNVYRSWMASPA